MNNYFLQRLEHRVLFGAHVVADLTPGMAKEPFASSVQMDGWLYFWSNTVVNSSSSSTTELWRTRGTPNQTFKVATVPIGISQSVPSDLAVLNHRLFFNGYDLAHGVELWSSDGTAGGTGLFADLVPGTNGSLPYNFRVLNGSLLFIAGRSDGVHGLWRSDGVVGSPPITLTGSVEMVSDYFGINAGDRIYFFDSSGYPWRTDGTSVGTYQISTKVAYQGLASAGRIVWDAATIGNKLVFSGVMGNLMDLWVSDGTDAGTEKLTSFNYNGSFAPVPVSDGTKCYFNAWFDSVVQPGTWVTDGTVAGTSLALTQTKSPFATAGEFQGKMLFPASSGAFLTDGTQAGTVQLSSTIIGPTTARVGDWPLRATDEVLAGFSGRTTSTGTEPCITDGTAAGTQIFDVNPGTVNSTPTKFVFFNKDLYFEATNVTSGRDLWRIDITPPTLTNGSFNVDTPQQAIVLTFDDDVSTSAVPAALTLNRVGDPSPIPAAAISVAYDPIARTAAFGFSGYDHGALPDGNYHAVFNSLSDYAGNALAVSPTIDFFVLAADANRDRKVNTLDFNILAGNFGGMGKVFSEGDFNYDGSIDSVDFDVLIGQYGKTLAAANSVPLAMSVGQVPVSTPLFAVRPDAIPSDIDHWNELTL